MPYRIVFNLYLNVVSSSHCFVHGLVMVFNYLIKICIIDITRVLFDCHENDFAHS